MISISCSNISLAFGTDVILDKITFALNDGEKLGIVGVNGAGKSTLFRVITGEYPPDEGQVFVAKDHTVGMLEQNILFDSQNSIFDEALLAFPRLTEMEAELESLQRRMERGESELAGRYAELHDRFTRDGGYAYRGRCKGILKNLGLGEELWYTKVSALSGGQKTRLALSKLLLSEPDILMLDEPTNHLDMEALYWLEEYLASYKKTVLLISHDRYFLDRITTKILEIEHRRGKLYNGNYSAFQAQKQKDREIEEKHYQNQQKEIARIEAYIEQQRRWNRERNIIAAESRQKMLDKMEKLERPKAAPEAIRFGFVKSGESGNDVLYVHGLSKGYRDRPLFHDLDLLIQKREHVFITGPNGCGKSTLLKILAGKIRQDRGEFSYGHQVTVGYYDQENQDLDENNTVLDEVWNAYEDLTQTQIRNALALFMFRGDDIEKKVSVLSGGEKARLTLCKLVLSKMNFLILDEPTNHLDINSREVLENALLQFDGTILAVSHDRYFINKLCDRVLDFAGDGPGLTNWRGSYRSYVEHKKARQEEKKTAEEPVISNAKEAYLQNKKSQAEARKQERKLKLTEEEIEKLEKEIAEIDQRCETEAATDHVLLGKLYEQRQTCEEQLEELYALLDELM